MRIKLKINFIVSVVCLAISFYFHPRHAHVAKPFSVVTVFLYLGLGCQLQDRLGQTDSLSLDCTKIYLCQRYFSTAVRNNVISDWIMELSINFIINCTLRAQSVKYLIAYDHYRHACGHCWNNGSLIEMPKSENIVLFLFETRIQKPTANKWASKYCISLCSPSLLRQQRPKKENCTQRVSECTHKILLFTVNVT